MPSRRRKKRKKPRKTGVNYGTPKTPWNTENPTRAEDKEESIPREAQRVREEDRREKEENIFDDLQQDIQRWWKAYGLSQCIIHDALPRLYNKRQSRGETFTLTKIKIGNNLSGLYEKRLETQLEEEKRVERETKSEEEEKIKQAKKAEEETIQDKNRSKEIVEWNEECWERTMIWCEAMNVSTQDIDWCPDAEWEFVTQCRKKREELSAWSEACYTARWIDWEEKNRSTLDKLDRIAELMTERRKEMIQVRNWKGDKQELREVIEASIRFEDDQQGKRKAKEDERSTTWRSREKRRRQKRHWREIKQGQEEEKVTKQRTSAWEQRRRETMEPWEAPPLGPPWNRESSENGSRRAMER